MSRRATAYLSERIDGQHWWYRDKATLNSRLEGYWFWAIVAAQVLAALSAVVLIIWPLMPLNGLGVFSALAAALAAWMQVKRHQELAQTYAGAAHELGLIRERGSRIVTDADLSAFVLDAEQAISREHGLWVARRVTAD